MPRASNHPVQKQSVKKQKRLSNNPQGWGMTIAVHEKKQGKRAETAVFREGHAGKLPKKDTVVALGREGKMGGKRRELSVISPG